MEDHPNRTLDRPYLKSVEESVWLIRMELEANRVRVEEEMRARDDIHLLNNNNNAINQYQSIIFHKLFLQHHHSYLQHHHQPITPSGFCLSETILFPPPTTKGLPENGKFLESVMKAGPLLQNLLLAGALPQWRHPPPPLDTYQTPLSLSEDYVGNISSKFNNNKKRGFCGDSNSSKYQKISLYN
ncbi:hypothetical protein R6Q59_014808 [Mikania micrantha]|uniref:Uncharacterized protein n=1 Tax=Mikania micrantha TaxID=192012 RepID=A0A5N6PAE2_9ASTR|nr:hypothetical protein E3N88_13125 [Mikania micrantha]